MGAGDSVALIPAPGDLDTSGAFPRWGYSITDETGAVNDQSGALDDETGALDVETGAVNG